jgi:NAD(P)H-hydrate epimerase
MGALKLALVSAPGFAWCGDVEVADIGIPWSLMLARSPRAMLLERGDVRGWLPTPSALDHKGTRGHLLVVGGAPGMRGAGRLSATSGLRAGAGLVTLAAPPGDDFVAPDSVMTAALTGALGELLARKAAVVIGPGLGTGADARGWLDEVLAAGLPAVLDADALNLSAAAPARLASAAGPLVLTPHPGEAARLLATTIAAVEADRLAAARTLAAMTGAVVVLKGARTVICDGTIARQRDAEAFARTPDAATSFVDVAPGAATDVPLVCVINPTGGPALATAGSGDVLAGAIGALLAQGVAPGAAACAAVYVHGLAGERLEDVHGRGAVSSDLPPAIAAVIAQLRA